MPLAGNTQQPSIMIRIRSKRRTAGEVPQAVDTSVLGAYYCPEPLGPAAESALQRLDDPVISTLTEVEFAAYSWGPSISGTPATWSPRRRHPCASWMHCTSPWHSQRASRSSRPTATLVARPAAIGPSLSCSREARPR